MNSKTKEQSSFDIVNIIVSIDTEALVADFKGQTPSQNSNTPTPIGHQYAYMVATRGSVIIGSGTADLNIQANVGDLIRWNGVSESDNFDSSVLVYGLPQYGGGQPVFSNPSFKVFTKASMQPANNGIFPVAFTNQTFWFVEADIQNTGVEHYQIQFGLYYRPTGGAQQLFGYFCWDPTITVNN